MNRINKWLVAMTLEEKVGQLNMLASSQAVTGPGNRRAVEEDIRAGRIGSLLNLWGGNQARAVQRIAVDESRLGIPLLLTLDVIHGHRTIFPVPLAEACLFDPDLWEKTARAAAAEATLDGIALTFAPMLDVARDPRWGRIVEGPGEDPWVASQFAAAKTRGFQGDDLAAAHSLAAVAKHLCAYGAVTAGREYASADLSDRTLREIYLPPFSAAAAAGTAAIMPAFIDIAGVPMTANAPLLQGWLRGQLGFEGVLISDYNAVAELLNHGVAKDIAEAAALALKAGVDIDMMSNAYTQGLPEALERGLVTMGEIDASVRRVLELKERLGLFDDPYRRGSAKPETGDGRALAREAARRAIVLLSCKDNILPLSPDIGHVALIGPLAAAPGEMMGPWSSAGRGDDAVSFLDGLKAALPECRIDSASGVDVDSQSLQGIPAAIELCRNAELTVLCLGEDVSMSGEAASRTDLDLPGCQRTLAEKVLDLGKPVVVLLSSGRPLVSPWLFERADAVLATWFLGSEAGNAVADVLTGKFNPTGKLAITWPRHVGQVPVFYGQRPTGRPTKAGERYTSSYLDLPVTPQFPFGHGLSYSRFTLSDLRCSPSCAKPGESVEISLMVRNDSLADGEATLFLFVRDLVASVARPLLELKAFRKIALSAGEQGWVNWTLPIDSLNFVGLDLRPVLEPGQFEIHVGQSADPGELLTTIFELIP